MVISDLRMETEDSGLEVLRVARRQSYNPATALLTAYPPTVNPTGESGGEEDWSAANSDSLLIKPLGTSALLRQVEALLVSHADKSQSNGRNQTQPSHSTKAQDRKRHAG
jgi:DNA-binding response OmpR family regulator